MRRERARYIMPTLSRVENYVTYVNTYVTYVEDSKVIEKWRKPNATNYHDFIPSRYAITTQGTSNESYEKELYDDPKNMKTNRNKKYFRLGFK